MDENDVMDIEQPTETGDDVSVIDSPDTENDIQIAEETETELETYALTSAVNGTISDTYLDYFEGVVQKLPYDSHYVIFKSADYAYTMAYGKEIEENDGQFTGECETVKIERIGDGYSTYWVVNHGSDSLSLDTGEAFVYSDLGVFPTVERGLSSLEAETLLFGLAVAFVFSIVAGVFSHVGFRRR